jgi:flagellar hook-associated protein 2
MAGALSSLGIGSGVLTFDVIDQLRTSDEEKKIKPIQTNKEKGQEKMTALDELIISVSEFKAAQNPLAEELTYLDRTTEVTGDEAEVEVEGGVNPQTINLHIDQLAKQDILQTKNFATAESVAVYQDTTLNVYIDETEYNINLSAGLTLSELASEFSAQTDGKVIGSSLKVGGEDPYKLVLKSETAGNENRILLGNTRVGKSYDDDFDLDSLSENDMVINGVNIFESASTYNTLSDVVDAVNAKSDTTHVKAFLSNDGNKLIFNNADGMQIDFTGSNFDDTNSANPMTALGLKYETVGGVSASTTGDAMAAGAIDDGGGSRTYGADEFLINGVDILDGVTVSSNQDIIDAIQSKFGETGVSAELVDGDKIKLNNQMGGAIYLDDDGTGTILADLGLTGKELTGVSVTATSDIGDLGSNHRFDENDFQINGINIFDDNTKPADIDEVITLINAKQGETGVEADKSGDKLVLRSTDGGSISFYGSDDDQLKHLGLYGSDKASPISQNSFLTRMNLDHENIYGIGYDPATKEYATKGEARVQEPQDAEFFFNGVKITRNTNEVDDLIVGAKITLLKVHEKDDDIVKAEVKRDTEKIYESFKESMEKYNEMINKIKEVTNYDYDTKEVGALQGVSEVSRIHSQLSGYLLYMDSTIEYKSLVDMGLSVEKDGALSMDYEQLKEKIEEDPEAIEKLFRGYDAEYRGETEFMEGIWTKMNNALKSYITDDDSTLKLYEKKLKEEDTGYDEEIAKAVEDLDSKYEIMQNKFAAYDEMIANMQNKFAPVQMMISQSLS